MNQNQTYQTVTYPMVNGNIRVPTFGLIQSPISFNPPEWELYPDEIFIVIDDRVLRNVIVGRYLISNYGRIWDNAYGKFLPFRYNEKYNEDGTNGGYFICNLAYYIDWNKLGSKEIYVHRAVLLMFKYNPLYYTLEGNHKNGKREDNTVWNLEWVTPRENKEHAIQHQLMRNAENHPNTSISNDKAKEICQLMEQGYSNSTIAHQLNVDTSLVYNIRIGHSFRHIGKQFKLDTPVTYDEFKLTDDVVTKICEELSKGCTIDKVSKDLDVPYYKVKDIKDQRNYKHITKLYNFEKRSSKLSIETVHEICKRLEKGESCIDITRALNLGRNTVSSIKRGASYPNISKLYNIPESKKRITMLA